MSVSIAPEGIYLFDTTVTVRWGDMDALGHVNNIMYFRYFEHTRLLWVESLGYSALGTDAVGTVIVDNHAEYVKPVHYPAELSVKMGGHSPGRSSFISTYTISIGDTLYTRGSAKFVWIDAALKKSIAIPDKVRNLLEGQ